MKNIGKKELEAFEEFENKILSLKDERIKYERDSEMESMIKKEVLFENFGEEKTTELLNRLSLSFLDLINQSSLPTSHEVKLALLKRFLFSPSKNIVSAVPLELDFLGALGSCLFEFALLSSSLFTALSVIALNGS
jgi:hypothetical protein